MEISNSKEKNEEEEEEERLIGIQIFLFLLNTEIFLKKTQNIYFLIFESIAHFECQGTSDQTSLVFRSSL